MFSLACNLFKNDVEFLPVEISSKNVRGNNVDFSPIEITSKKVPGKNMDISTSEITPKKGRGNDLDFSISKITSKKVRGNDVNFSISEITSKKYVKMTWKLVEIWSSTYQCNIDVESTWIRRGVPVGRPLLIYTCLKPRRYHNLYL